MPLTNKDYSTIVKIPKTILLGSTIAPSGNPRMKILRNRIKIKKGHRIRVINPSENGNYLVRVVEVKGSRVVVYDPQSKVNLIFNLENINPSKDTSAKWETVIGDVDKNLDDDKPFAEKSANMKKVTSAMDDDSDDLKFIKDEELFKIAQKLFQISNGKLSKFPRFLKELDNLLCNCASSEKTTTDDTTMDEDSLNSDSDDIDDSLDDFDDFDDEDSEEDEIKDIDDIDDSDDLDIAEDDIDDEDEEEDENLEIKSKMKNNSNNSYASVLMKNLRKHMGR